MNNLPRIFQWLLDIFCPPHRQDLKGDVLELYDLRREKYGVWKANATFLADMLTVIPLRWTIRQPATPQPRNPMFVNNLKGAGRNLKRNKLYAMIHLTGLSVSLAACMLIAMFVLDELSYDDHFRDSERVYRVSGRYIQGGNARIGAAATSYTLMPMIASGFAGVESIARLDFHTEMITVEGDKQYMQDALLYTDSSFFDIFSVNMISGDPATVLDDPTAVVLDQQTARKYYGSENPMGKTISLNGKLFTVRGLMEDLPVTTHFKAHAIFPMSGVEQWYPDWVIHNVSGRSLYTYIRVSDHFDKASFEAQMIPLMKKAWNNDAGYPELFLQPLPSIHLAPKLQGEIQPGGSQTDVYIFTIAAVIILLLACINYVNLSMAAALPRSKEAGIRRVLGSTVRMVVAQFQTESFLILFISALLASVMTWIAMPAFNELSGKNLVFQVWSDPVIALGLAAIILIVALIAGCAPAFTLLRSGTINMLSGKLEFRRRNFSASNVLVVFQFAITVSLIASTLIVTDQIRYIRNKDIGVNTERLLIVPLQRLEIADRYEVLRTELLRNPDVQGVTASTNKVTGGVFGWRVYVVDSAKGQQTVPTVTVQHDFFETMGAQVLDGRTFSRDFSSDFNSSYVVNESAAALLGLNKPVGQGIEGLAFNGNEWNRVKAHIVGVVKDFHFGSLHTKPEPVIFSLSSEMTEPLRWMEIRISGDNTEKTLASIESIWNKIAPERAFSYEFMQDALKQYYMGEDQFMKLFIVFSGLSILIGALGLFGLTAFATRRRTKEIGIRKVIGASTAGLIRLLSSDFLKLVLIANVIGWPVAWYMMDRWLENFAFHTTITVWTFILTGIAAIVIAFSAILYHSLKASSANPVKALRQE